MTASTDFANATSQHLDVARLARKLMLEPGRAVLHVATFVAVSAGLIGGGAQDIASGSASLWLLVAWGVVAATDLLAVLALRAVSGTADEHPPIPAGGGIVMTGSISSTVKLDYDAGTAEKTYEATGLVRALYRLSFQAAFPYTDNVAALDAAAHRRTVAGLLTKFWFGENMVAQALDVRHEPDGSYAFVTELVRGTEPRDRDRAKATLRQLTERFGEAGLPTWQVGYYNPKAIPNLLEQADGSYRIIDLESNLVTPFMPPAALIRAVRNGQYPSFDDIDVDRLRAYLSVNREQIVTALGDAESTRLFDATASYAAAQGEWFADEPRIASKLLRFAFRLVDVPTWVRGLRRISTRVTSGGERLADDFVRAGIDAWADEGHLAESEAEELRTNLATPEVASAMAHLGVHMAISVPLRFPFGSIARAVWTVVARARAEWRALRRRGSAKAARQVHTIPIALMAAVPGFGTFAYMLAKPFRANSALGVIIFDRALRKVPGRVYWRLHLSALMTWFARPGAEATGRRGLASTAAAVRDRVAAVNGHWLLIGAVVAFNATALAAAAVLYNGYDMTFALSEFGLINSLDAAQLLVAGVLGILAFRFFWRGAARVASANESAGIFLWGITGIGLVGFAFDDFLGVHERVGGWIARNLDVIPLFTNNVDDFITLAYGVVGLTVLAVFRQELFAKRASSMLLVAGVVAAALMLGTDAYGHGFAKSLEFPAQVTAVGLLMVANLTRYREVRAALPRAVERTAPAPLPVAQLASLPIGGGK